VAGISYRQNWLFFSQFWLIFIDRLSCYARECPRPAAKRGDPLACAAKRNAEEFALLKDAPGNEDWAAVGQAIRERMRERGVSATQLAQETGLSPMTIRHIGEPMTKRRTKSTLVAISAVLEWRYDHLTNILRGEPEKNLPGASPLEPYFENLLRAEVGPVKEEVAGIRDIIHVIDKKIDVIIESQHAPVNTAGQPRPAPAQPPEQV
jgi:transcriptional regulator with XRE-family HTH domain